MTEQIHSRIIGIDPGSRVTGWGIIETTANSYRHIANGQIKVSGAELSEKLHCIHSAITAVIAEHMPQEAAIESVFVHRNAGSALKLGQARGAAIVAAANFALPLYEYAPTAIKKALVGRGHAAKEQVQHMVTMLLDGCDIAGPDAADALAVAVCHSHMRRGLARIPGARKVVGGRLM